MKMISPEHKFRCSLISKYPYKNVKDVIEETAQAQLDSCEKELTEIIDWVEDADIITMLSPRQRRGWQALKQKHLNEKSNE